MTLGTLPAKPLNSRFNDSQWEAIHQRGSNILVSASAGSGKTTVLIERILNHLLTHYANMDQLLVSTFTEAAASEMKARMENRLKQAVNRRPIEPSKPIWSANFNCCQPLISEPCIVSACRLSNSISTLLILTQVSDS